MNVATGVVLAFDIVTVPVVLAAGLCLIYGEKVPKHETTPEAARLLDQARADYNSDKAHQIRQNLGWEPKDETLPAQFDVDGILKDGSEG